MTDAMETVRAARASDKLSAHYLREHLFSDFVELHGDRQGQMTRPSLGDRPVCRSASDRDHHQPGI